MLNNQNIKDLLAEKIKLQREELNYTQEDLAKLASLGSVQKVSKIEKGEQNIKADELFRIAQILYIDLNDLFTTKKNEENIVLWRKEPENNSDKDSIINDFFNYCELYSQAESWIGINCKVDWNTFVKKPDSLTNSEQYTEYAKNLAQEIQEKYDFGAKPAFYIKDFLEDVLCVKIYFKDIKSYYNNKNIGAALSSISKYGAGILINSTDVDHRINFSLAHELFHLLTWNVIDPKMLEANQTIKENVEKMANVFASELLLPERYLKAAFDASIDQNSFDFYYHLSQLAKNFFVSFQVIVIRLHFLGLLEENASIYLNQYDNNYYFFKSLIKQGPKVYNENTSERYLSILLTAYQMDKISLGRVSEITGLGIKSLKDILRSVADSNEEISREIQTNFT